MDHMQIKRELLYLTTYYTMLLGVPVMMSTLSTGDSLVDVMGKMLSSAWIGFPFAFIKYVLGIRYDGIVSPDYAIMGIIATALVCVHVEIYRMMHSSPIALFICPLVMCSAESVLLMSALGIDDIE